MAAEQIRHIRAGMAADETIGLVSGNFNVVHPGHLRLLKFASENCDRLVVAVHPDGAREITVPANMRLEALEAISMVDHALILDRPLADLITQLKPDIVVKGNEHKLHPNIEEPLVEAYGGRLIFASGDVTFSSLGLLRNELDDRAGLHTVKPRGYLDRHGFSGRDLAATLASFAGVRVTVIGDLIIDSYVNCEPVGMSQEDPTIVVTPTDEKLFVGGAGIVAAHARGLGADVRLFTIVGKDDLARFAHDKLGEQQVDVHALVDETRPTTLKRRFRAHGKTLLRVNDMRQHAIDDHLIERMIDGFDAILDTTDLLLFSDFNYGCLPQPLVDALVARGRERNIMMAADSQASSQYADISRFRHMAMITPTERETRLAIRDFSSGLVVAAEKLQQAADARNVVVTLGAEGLIVRGWKGEDPVTDRLPSFNSAPLDVAGAGDSLFTSSALALRTGADIWASIYLGSIAAGCQVARVGNRPLGVGELLAELRELED